VLSHTVIRLSLGSFKLYEQKMFLINCLFWSSVSYFLRLHEWKFSEHFSAFRSFPKNKSYQHNVMFISSNKYSHLLVASQGRDHVVLRVHTHYVDRMTVNNIENTEALHGVTCDDARMTEGVMKLESRQPLAEMRGRGNTGAVRSCNARDHTGKRG